MACGAGDTTWNRERLPGLDDQPAADPVASLGGARPSQRAERSGLRQQLKVRANPSGNRALVGRSDRPSHGGAARLVWR